MELLLTRNVTFWQGPVFKTTYRVFGARDEFRDSIKSEVRDLWNIPELLLEVPVPGPRFL